MSNEKKAYPKLNLINFNEKKAKSQLGPKQSIRWSLNHKYLVVEKRISIEKIYKNEIIGKQIYLIKLFELLRVTSGAQQKSQKLFQDYINNNLILQYQRSRYLPISTNLTIIYSQIFLGAHIPKSKYNFQAKQVLIHFCDDEEKQYEQICILKSFKNIQFCAIMIDGEITDQTSKAFEKLRFFKNIESIQFVSSDDKKFQRQRYIEFPKIPLNKLKVPSIQAKLETDGLFQKLTKAEYPQKIEQQLAFFEKSSLFNNFARTFLNSSPSLQNLSIHFSCSQILSLGTYLYYFLFNLQNLKTLKIYAFHELISRHMLFFNTARFMIDLTRVFNSLAKCSDTLENLVITSPEAKVTNPGKKQLSKYFTKLKNVEIQSKITFDKGTGWYICAILNGTNTDLNLDFGMATFLSMSEAHNLLKEFIKINRTINGWLKISAREDAIISFAKPSEGILTDFFTKYKNAGKLNLFFEGPYFGIKQMQQLLKVMENNDQSFHDIIYTSVTAIVPKKNIKDFEYNADEGQFKCAVITNQSEYKWLNRSELNKPW